GLNTIRRDDIPTADGILLVQAAQPIEQAGQDQRRILFLSENANDAGDALARSLIEQAQAHLDRVGVLLGLGSEKDGQSDDQNGYDAQQKGSHRHQSLSLESPSPPYSGARGWGEGVEDHSPSPPTPLPGVPGRGESLSQGRSTHCCTAAHGPGRAMRCRLFSS